MVLQNANQKHSTWIQICRIVVDLSQCSIVSSNDETYWRMPPPLWRPRAQRRHTVAEVALQYYQWRHIQLPTKDNATIVGRTVHGPPWSYSRWDCLGDSVHTVYPTPLSLCTTPRAPQCLFKQQNAQSIPLHSTLYIHPPPPHTLNASIEHSYQCGGGFVLFSHV